ncbi:MAG: hypothetical protein QXT67_04730 [Candidatus Bathyarchaeia archaeon]
MENEDAPSIGRIVLFGLMLALFFVVVFQSITFFVDVLYNLPDVVGEAVGEHPSFMPTLYQITYVLTLWLRRMFTNPLSLAAIICIAFIYWVLNERER